MEREEQSSRTALQRQESQAEIERLRARVAELEAVVVGLGKLLVLAHANDV